MDGVLAEEGADGVNRLVERSLPRVPLLLEQVALDGAALHQPRGAHTQQPQRQPVFRDALLEQKSCAARQITSVKSVGVSSVVERVNVRKSEVRTFNSTVRPRTPRRRSRPPSCSTRSNSQARKAARSSTSRAKVVSVLSDWACSSVTTGRSSRPWASCQKWRPAVPKWPTRTRSGTAAT